MSVAVPDGKRNLDVVKHFAIPVHNPLLLTSMDQVLLPVLVKSGGSGLPRTKVEGRVSRVDFPRFYAPVPMVWARGR